MARALVLLPSSTYRATDFVTAASALAVELIVGSDEAQTVAPALVVDFGDPDAAAGIIERYHAHHPLDGIVAADDQGVVVAAMAAARLGLRHNPPEAAARTRDKAALRECLEAAGVPQPRYRVVRPGDDLSAVGFPAVLKPLSLAASRGVIRVDDAGAAASAAARIRTIVGDESAALLLEGYVPGDEVAVEGLLDAGRLDVLAVFDKPDPLVGPYFEETIYVTPARLSPVVLDAVHSTTAAAADALGLREGPVHAELRIDGDGGVHVLEVAARSIGGLCGRSLHFGLTGSSLEELLIRHAVGRPLGGLRRETEATGVMMLPVPRPGRLTAVEGTAEALAIPGIVGLEIAVPLGRQVVPLPEGDRYLGFLFAKALGPDVVEAALRTAYAALRIVIA